MTYRFRCWAVATLMGAAGVLVSQGVATAQEDGDSNSSVESSAFMARPAPRVRVQTGKGSLGRAVWIASVAALAAANISDAKTSWNKYEGNGVLAGRGGKFGAKGVAIKGSINAAWIASQVVALRKNPENRAVAIVNFAAASILGVLAYRNSTIPGPAGGSR